MKNPFVSPNTRLHRRPRQSFQSQFALASFAALSLFASQPASAVTDTFNASTGTTESWATAGNWALGVPTSTEDVLIDYSLGTTATALGLDGAQAGNSLTFSSSAGPLPAFTLEANSTAVTTARTLTLTTGNVTFDSSLTGAVTIGGNASTNGVLTLASTANAYAFTNNSSQTVNLAAVISNGTTSTVTYTGTGSGTFVVSGANTYSGQTTIGNSTIKLGNATAFGASSLIIFAASSTGGIQLNGFSPTVTSINTNTPVGTTFIENGSSTNSTLTITQGSNLVNLASTIRDGTGGGNLSIFKGTGGRTLILTGANTFTGTVGTTGTIQASTLNSVATSTTLGTTHAASSNLGAPTTVANGTITLGGQTNAGTLNDVGTGETTDRVINLNNTTAASSTINQSGTGTLLFTSAVASTSAGNKTFSLGGSTAGIGNIQGVIGDVSSTVTSNGIAAFASGATTISVATTGASFGVGATVSGTGIVSGTTITAASGTTYTLSTPTTSAGGGTSAANTLTFSGGITSVAKSGTGNWILSSPTGNTYTGGTALTGTTAGTLTVTNTSGSATGSGSVALGATTGSVVATLASGAGTSGGAATIRPGGAGAVGLLTLTTLTAASGATFAYDLGTTAAATDHITLTTLNATGTGTGGLVFSFSGAGTVGTTYDLVDYTLAGSTLSASQLSATGANGTFSLDANSTSGLEQIDFTVAAVPEPSTWIAGVLAMGMVAWTLRKRWSSASSSLQY